MKIEQWFDSQGWRAFPFQKQAWQAYLSGKSGIVNAPTGSGKTYSVLGGILEQAIRESSKQKGLQAIWITPIRALAKEIQQSAERAIHALDLQWEVGIRTGDTSGAEKQKQKKAMPQLLITTPESLHLILATKNYPKLLENLRCVVVDEWHELIGSKRGVQMELALAWLRKLNPKLITWGISATIGNLPEAMDVLLGEKHQGELIKANIQKKIKVESVMPDEVETMPWAGHLGIKLLEKVLPKIEKSSSTLIFTNTRAQCEIWYQKLLEVAPELAGVMAMHHGSISKELRFWVEEALYDGRLKVVVCTSSLDLGVDFRPVETIVQIGSPKGVSRFLQRAGRSGHQPGATSKIYFVPTHSLELIEGAALREAIDQQHIEPREPYVRSFDVLIQFMVTLAVSDGFESQKLFQAVKTSFSYQSISYEDWQWCLRFITQGGDSLGGYDEFHRVVVEEGIFKVTSKRVALRHRLGMGTIVSDTHLRVKFVSGGFIGSIEEWFVSKLKPGDVFWFGGRSLELVRIKGLDVQVKLSKSKTGLVPSWMGGRMPLSAQMGEMLRIKLEEAFDEKASDPELKFIEPIWRVQAERSIIPGRKQFLIEKMNSREGCHVFCYPFEGRAVHEGIAFILAYRLSLLKPISLSIAMNDYGFELLCPQDIPIEEAIDNNLFTIQNLQADILQSVNAVEMARKRFRDIASISGLVFQGFPGKPIKEKHLQSSSLLIFNTLSEYEPYNLLLRQAYEEVMYFQLEESRMRAALERIAEQEIVITYPKKPSPFCFPIMVDRLRERMSTESLEERVKRMIAQA